MIPVKPPYDRTPTRVVDLLYLDKKLGKARSPRGTQPYLEKAKHILKRLDPKDLDAPMPDGLTLRAWLDRFMLSGLAKYAGASDGSAAGGDANAADKPKGLVFAEDRNAAAIRDLILEAERHHQGEGAWRDDDPILGKIAAAIPQLPPDEINRDLDDGGTVLLHLVRCGCAGLVGLAIGHGAKAGKYWHAPYVPVDGKKREREGWPDLSIWYDCSAFEIALETGDRQTALAIARSNVRADSLGKTGTWPAAEALSKKWYDVFRALAESAKVDINRIDGDGFGLWHYAVDRSDPEIAKLAVSLGANPDAADKDGNAPLHLASLRGNASFIRALLDAGADPCVHNARYESPLALAVRHGKPASIAVLAADRPPESFFDGAGNTELHFAVRARNLDYCRYLAYRGAEKDSLNNRNRQPIEHALESGDRAIADFLDGKSAASFDSRGQLVADYLRGIRTPDSGEPAETAAEAILDRMYYNDIVKPLADGNQLILHLALLDKPAFAARVLTKGANANAAWKPNPRDKSDPIDDSTDDGGGDFGKLSDREIDMLLNAIKTPEYLNLYIDDGYCTPAGNARDGATPIDIAFDNHFRELSRVLVDSDASIKRGADEISFLRLALEKRWMDVAQALVNRGSDPEALDPMGQTVWHWFANETDPELLGFAGSLRCDPNRARPRDGVYPLLIAASYGNAAAIRAMLDAGADPLLRAENGSYPLGVALKNGHAEAFETLLAARDVSTYTDDEGRTLLHHAVKIGNYELAMWLIDRELYVDAPDQAGETPLMVAVFTHDPELVAVLLRHGADTAKKRRDGKNALAVAEFAGCSSEMIDLLTWAGIDQYPPSPGEGFGGGFGK